MANAQIDKLHDFINGNERASSGDGFPPELSGYAARDAAKTLLANWETAIGDGNRDDLPKDIDNVIELLSQFKERALLCLPVENGGFGGTPPEEWEQRLLDEHDVFIYEAEDLPGHFGYTSCDADMYMSLNDALLAAMKAFIPDDELAVTTAKKTVKP